MRFLKIIDFILFAETMLAMPWISTGHLRLSIIYFNIQKVGAHTLLHNHLWLIQYFL